jgi:dienelactone hydrolase
MIELSTPDDGRIKPLRAYVVGNEQGSRAVLVFSDVFGIDSGNHKVVCDTIAERLGDDTLVIMPDLFRGCAIVGGWGLPNSITMALALPSIVWNIKMRVTPGNIERDLKSIIQPYLKQTKTVTKVSCVGFCFGGWVVGRALALNGFDCQSGVAIHPSWKAEKLVGSLEQLVAGVGKKPILFLPAANDVDCKVDTPLIQQLAKQRGVDPSDLSIAFEEMKHGWVTRGDDSVQEIARDIEKALNLTVKFIQEHSSKSLQ